MAIRSTAAPFSYSAARSSRTLTPTLPSIVAKKCRHQLPVSTVWCGWTLSIVDDDVRNRSCARYATSRIGKANHERTWAQKPGQ